MTPHKLLCSVQQQQISVGEADSFSLSDIIEYSTEWPANSQYYSVVNHQGFDYVDTFELDGNKFNVD